MINLAGLEVKSETSLVGLKMVSLFWGRSSSCSLVREDESALGLSGLLALCFMVIVYNILTREYCPIRSRKILTELVNQKWSQAQPDTSLEAALIKYLKMMNVDHAELI